MTDNFTTVQATTWTRIRDTWHTAGAETVSGPGSELGHTTAIRQALPALIEQHKIRSILDAPCGDWNWMRHVDLRGVHRYTGWDIEPDIVAANQERFSTPGRVARPVFECVNLLTTTRIPKVDLILCRDFLIHLPNDQITIVLDKFVFSGSRYLLATNHPAADNNPDLDPNGQDGYPAYWQRLVNLTRPPFNLPDPTAAITEPGHPVCPDGNQMALFDLHHA